MDIENMHPFCLPFGLCHDAANSPSDCTNEKDKIRSKASSPSTDELFRHLNSQANNNSASSPLLNTDDLLIGSSSSLGANNGGGGAGDLESFYSLELDINTDTSDDINFHELDDESDAKVGQNANSAVGNEENNGECDEDDWYYDQFSLFSPPESSSAAGSSLKNHLRKSSSLVIRHSGLGGHHHHHQHHLFATHHPHSDSSSLPYHHAAAAAFQHVVDPIDIKSSPTLAQLNLNSQDDPTDGLWDTSAPAAASSTATAAATTTTTSISSSAATAASSSSNHHRNSNSNCSNIDCSSASQPGGSGAHATTNNLDLLSNCTSISNSILVAHNNNHHNHHHHHNHNHHQHQHRNQLMTSQTQNAMAPELLLGGGGCGNTCNHLHHQRAHHHHPSSGSLSPHSSHLGGPLAAASPCHHLHPHHHGHHFHHQSAPNESAASCARQLHGQHTAALMAPQSAAAGSQQTTCLAVAPFRRPDGFGSGARPCCHHHHHHQSQPVACGSLSQSLLSTAAQPVGCSANAIADGQNLNPQLDQQQQSHTNLPSNSSNSAGNCDNKQPADSLESKQQMRSASPALVSSSSSPLSSSCSSATLAANVVTAGASAASPAITTPAAPAPAPTATGAVGNSNIQQQQNRTLNDNKLKENIEYLTALLCNGNKLDSATGSSAITTADNLGGSGNNQQPTISSTMARSYATLAHTLSTGPKLLDQPQSISAGPINFGGGGVGANQQPQTVTGAQQQPAGSSGNSAVVCHHKPASNCNEATSCLETGGQQLNSSQSSSSSLKRAYPEQQWFNKPQQQVVESSVSAADSTESPTKCQATGANQQQACSMQHYSSIQQQQPQQPQQPTMASCHQRPGELKVLSSLLSSSKCPGANQQQPQQQQAPVVACNAIGWNHHTCHHHHHHPPPGQQQQPNESGQRQLGLPNEQLLQSIPPNGKPITLTPISSHNNPIIAKQEQRQSAGAVGNDLQLQKKARSSSLFAQPASPSASSTASSGSTTTSAGHPVVPIKRQRGSVASSTASGQLNQTSLANQAGGVGEQVAKSSRSGRPNSMSTDCSLSSHDEGFSSQIDLDDCQDSARESDDDDEVDSDDESFYGDYTNSDLIGASISDNAENKWTLNMGRTRRNGQKRYFWQYNVQSKGPKGTRICPADDSEDPFVLPEASDPVFSNDCQVEGVKHSGKARRGDGNDLTPNPRKLLMIGLELKKLGKIINELAPVTDLPVNARNKTRKEKNKLASRACRLKKKAQHEANKIKLYGLQREHQQVVMAIYDIRKLLNETLSSRETNKEEIVGAGSAQVVALKQQQQQMAATNSSLTNGADDNGGNVNLSVKTIAEQCSMKVAGQTSDYVNSVLEKVVSGCIDGGLQT